jgi:hypothetical protein
MSDFNDTFVEALRQQSWALYSIGIFIILLRLCVLTPSLSSSH